jgi:murein L,D-transpeptidase YafK
MDEGVKPKFHIFVMLSLQPMRFLRILLLLLPLFLFSFFSNNFKKEQLKYPNVRAAYKEKWASVKDKPHRAGIDTNNYQVYIRVFKREAKLEVWAKLINAATFSLVETYDICRSSGTIGPKRRQGDGQVPEGFYEVESFNPQSEFYLALRVNYPNEADKINSRGIDPGGDIMIHGNCVTIGCMPLTDDKIKEVYIMAVEAKNKGQQHIPIHIFPTRLDDAGVNWLSTQKVDSATQNLWASLKQGYTYFETKRMLPQIHVNSNGTYTIQ